MPTAQVRLDPKRVLTEHEYVLLRLVFQEINAIRQAAGLPQRTEVQLNNAVRQILSDRRRNP